MSKISKTISFCLAVLCAVTAFCTSAFAGPDKDAADRAAERANRERQVKEIDRAVGRASDKEVNEARDRARAAEDAAKAAKDAQDQGKK